MKDGVPQNSPTPLPAYDATDEELAAELKKSGGRRPVHHPVGELLDRHWEAAFSYARLCTDGAHPAGMLTTAAFTRLFEESARQGGPTAAWRPQILVTVRRLAAEWDSDHRRTLLHPELRSHPGGGGRAAARLLPPENRRLVSRAFQRLTEPARCLLWHAEVEREELAAPAALLGIETAEAEIRLERARELLRAVCLDVHREFAPDEECRRYARLLDVSLHRGDSVLDPDLRRHMDGCIHCHHTAEQLEGFHQRLPLLLAEGVLGWGAQAYLATKTPRTEAVRTAKEPMAVPAGGEPLIDPADVRQELPAAGPRAPVDSTEPSRSSPAPVAVTIPSGGRRRAPRAAPGASGPRSTAAHKAPRRPSPHRRRLTLAVATVSALVLIPLALWSGARSGGDGRSRTGAPSGEPRPGAKESGSGSPSWVGAAADVPTGAFEGRLRNQGSGLCIGLDAKTAVATAEAVLVSCTSSMTQQWAYEADGLLRSVAAPDLCLDSHLGYSVQLTPCAGQSQPETRNVRYDFTLQGALVPRWDQDLALTPASSARGAGLVLKPRTEDDTQRWLADTSNTLRMQSVNWGTTAESATPEPRATGSHGTSSRGTGNGSRPTTSSPSPHPPGTCSSSYCPPNGQGGYGGGGGYGGQGGYGGGGGYDGYGGYGGWGGYGGGQYDADGGRR
ncbi:ricin-type beta-trefoil lectin domain protein [Streptomyces caeni]|uniref:Ricin-type beta-trefoil lectin domain protein n=1 Tax=Streptomyces caeni TaxID=2307231 RepID=A0ABW4IJN4_9ACTN